MSDYLRPEYTPLFTQVQDFIADQLNADPQLSALGIEFLPEHRLNIEYEIKNNLGKQGTVGIVNTLKGTYGGHDGSTNAWEIEAEVDVLENPPVRRAQMKKMGLSAGTTADVLDWIQESLCGPSSPTYGKFCAMSQELGVDRGIIVGRSIMKTFAIADVSAVISGEHHWVCPYALQSDLSALQEQVYDLSVDVHGDYIEDDEGNRIDADRTFTWREKSPWFISEMGNGYYTYDPPLECAWGTYTIDNGQSQTQTQMWMSKTPYTNNEYFGIGSNLEYVEYYNKDGDTYVAITGDMITEHTDNSITMIGMSSCSITRTGDWSDLTATLATLDDIPTKTSDLTNDSGFITSADIITKRDLNDLNIYVDPMADMTTTKFNVVVSYAGDPSSPLFTAELTHRGGEETAWTWSPSGSNQRISIEYYSTDGSYHLSYLNLQDGGGNEHSGSMTTPLTSPYWTGEVQDDWFHFSVTSQTTTITTKAYVDSLIAALEARIAALEGN